MKFALDDLDSAVRYRLLTGLVVPRPVAWITTLNEDGSVNLAPYSFFNVLGNDPPIVAFGASEKTPGVRKDTATNILREKEFVVHLATPEQARLVQNSAAKFPYGASEVEALGLETLPSETIAVPRLAVATIALECTFETTVRIGESEVLFGRIRHLHASDDYFEADGLSLRPGSVRTIGRLQGPGWYCVTSDQFNLGRMPSPDALLPLAGELPRGR